MIEEMVFLSEFIQAEFGITVPVAQHHTIARKVPPVMVSNGLNSVQQLKQECQNSKLLRQQLINAMTVNETFFFRDKSLWASLAENILRDCAEITKTSTHLRLLNCACSKGQEVYSLAMLLDEQRSLAHRQVEIDALDIDTEVLNYAKNGCYTDLEMSRGLCDARKTRYFEHQDGCWQINKELKSTIKFSRINLKSSFMLYKKYDLIFCRNVLIYFEASLKSEILERLAMHANDQAYLIVGGSESLVGLTDKWRMQHVGASVCYRKI